MQGRADNDVVCDDGGRVFHVFESADAPEIDLFRRCVPRRVTKTSIAASNPPDFRSFRRTRRAGVENEASRWTALLVVRPLSRGLRWQCSIRARLAAELIAIIFVLSPVELAIPVSVYVDTATCNATTEFFNNREITIPSEFGARHDTISRFRGGSLRVARTTRQAQNEYQRQYQQQMIVAHWPPLSWD
jgi:hypothetical protein